MASEAKRIAHIKKRMEKAEVQPWRVASGDKRFGCDVIEPYAAWGRHDVLIASNLDGATAAFLASVPDDMRFLLSYIERLEFKAKPKRKKK